MLSKKRGDKADWKNGKEIIALFVLNDLFLPNARGLDVANSTPNQQSAAATKA